MYYYIITLCAVYCRVQFPVCKTWTSFQTKLTYISDLNHPKFFDTLKILIWVGDIILATHCSHLYRNISVSRKLQFFVNLQDRKCSCVDVTDRIPEDVKGNVFTGVCKRGCLHTAVPEAIQWRGSPIQRGYPYSGMQGPNAGRLHKVSWMGGGGGGVVSRRRTVLFVYIIKLPWIQNITLSSNVYNENIYKVIIVWIKTSYSKMRIMC